MHATIRMIERLSIILHAFTVKERTSRKLTVVIIMSHLLCESRLTSLPSLRSSSKKVPRPANVKRDKINVLLPVMKELSSH